MDTRAGPARFATTRWSRVARARADDAGARRALGELCAVYWPPLYAYARRWGRSRPDAEDAVQGFLEVALRRGLFTSADAARGRFRSLLLTAFQNHLRDAAAHARAARRDPGSPPVPLEAVADEDGRPELADAGATPEQAYDRRWARLALDQALEALEARYRSEDKGAVFDALRGRLAGDDGDGMAAAAAALGMSEGAARVALHRLRHRFRTCLRAVVRETVACEDDVDRELEDLRRVLAGGSR